MERMDGARTDVPIVPSIFASIRIFTPSAVNVHDSRQH